MQTLLESLPTRMERLGATGCHVYVFDYAAACDRGAFYSPAPGRRYKDTAGDDEPDDVSHARSHATYSQ
jgi:hypothetical protein